MLYPVNRYISVSVPEISSDEESTIVLPEDYKPAESRFIEVVAVNPAWDVRFEVEEGDRLIVDRSMIEEISIGDTIYNVILDNYVVGTIE